MPSARSEHLGTSPTQEDLNRPIPPVEIMEPVTPNEIILSTPEHPNRCTIPEHVALPRGLYLGRNPNQIVVYSCTIVPGCPFTTLSHKSWFLHETRSHPGYLDIYLCNCAIDSTDGILRRCHVSSLNAGRFEQHRITHDYDPLYDLDSHLLGPRLGVAYYCGFCKWVSDVYGRERSTWYKARTQHVMDHFTGRIRYASLIWKFPKFLEDDG